MNWTLKRSKPEADGVFGTLFDENGAQIAVTLEHAFDARNGDGSYEAKTAPGTYTCTRYDSPDHGYQVFVLNHVPPFQGKAVTFIEIHIGNYNKDSDGCILVGSHRNGEMIMDSKVTFTSIMDLLKNVDSFTLTITEGD